jgi:hypothetical protein
MDAGQSFVDEVVLMALKDKIEICARADTNGECHVELKGVSALLVGANAIQYHPVSLTFEEAVELQDRMAEMVIWLDRVKRENGKDNRNKER